MSEPNFGDYIALNHAIIWSLVRVLNAAGVLTFSEIGAVCREAAEHMGNHRARSQVLEFAESLEAGAASTEGGPAPRWTPEVVSGGQNGGGKDGGGAAGRLPRPVACLLTSDT